MRIRAEIRCLNCGRYLGELEGEQNGFFGNAKVVRQPAPGSIVKTPRGLRCGRCGGKAIAESVERINTSTTAAA